MQKVAFIAGGTVEHPRCGTRRTGRRVTMGAGAIGFSAACCGGGIEFVSVVAGGTCVGAVGGAAGARGGDAVGAGAGAGGGNLCRVDPAGLEAALGRPRAAEGLGKGVCLIKHCEKWREREEEGGSATWIMWATRRTTDRKMSTTHSYACSSLSTHPSLPRVD